MLLCSRFLVSSLLIGTVLLAACETRAFHDEAPTSNTTSPTSFRVGGTPQPVAKNPQAAQYEQNAFHINEGKRYYEWYNCYSCHAAGGGDIGPPLLDDEWRPLAAAAVSPLHEAGESSFTLHMVEHELLMLVAAPLMFHTRQARGGRGLAVLCLFATSIVSGALGALMAFSQSPWYPRYAVMGLAPFGFTPVEDQQLAGHLMWIPGGLVHAIAALILLGALLCDSTPRDVHGNA